MPTILELRNQLALPKSTKAASVVNHALRRLVPGGGEVLDTLARLHEMQHSRLNPDPALQEMLDDLRTARDKMSEHLLSQGRTL